MKKSNVYILVLIALFLGLVFPKAVNPNQGLIFVVEEVIYLILFAIGILCFQKPVKRIIHRLEKAYNWKIAPLKRFGSELLIIIFAGLLCSSIIYWSGAWAINQFGMPKVYEQILLEKRKVNIRNSERDNRPYDVEKKNIKKARAKFIFIHLGGILLFIMLFLVEESYVFYNRQANERLKHQQLLKEQALMKASALQKQLNPHFMFNSLNVLLSLMHEDLNKSTQFVKKLSEIYRYVLEQSEEIVTTLRKEEQFILSYIYLLKIRFEEKIQFDIQISPDKYDYFIPTMTLEVLVENTIKHNIVSNQSPLRVIIYTENNRLIVKNNYQKRADIFTSHGVGISNLKKRLELLGLENTFFGIKNGHFIASIPLLEPN